MERREEEEEEGGERQIQLLRSVLHLSRTVAASSPSVSFLFGFFL